MSGLDGYLATLASVSVTDAVGMDVRTAEHAESSWTFTDLPEPDAPRGTALDLADRLNGGEVSSLELVRSVLGQPGGQAAREAGWAYLHEAAAQDAKASDERRAAGRSLGPLEGIPIGVKDLIHVAGQPTGCGSQHAYPGVADADAPCIARLRQAGAVIVGKTTTHEFAFGGTTPPTRNPWNPERIPGGSSGGSGAVVGAGQVPVAIGTDTAGSVRIPASYCGTVGFIGSRDVVPTAGVATLAWSLDTVGSLARSVADAALVNAVMAGIELSDAVPQPLLPSVVGIPREVLGPLDPGVEAAFSGALEILSTRGVATADVSWPDEDALQAVGFLLMMAESADFHRDRMRSPEKFDPEVADLLRMGQEISATDYIRARRLQAQLSREFERVFDHVPVILTPTLPCQPAPYGSGTFTPLPLGQDSMPLAAAHTRYPLIANVAGLPAGTVPCGLASGLPVGLQVMGPRGSDATVLAVMAGIERVLDEAGVWTMGATASLEIAREG